MSTDLHRSRVRVLTVDGIRQKPAFDIRGAKVAVIGLDPDGFSFAKRTASGGFKTIAFDTDEVKVAQLEAHEEERSARNLSITSRESDLKNADVYVICGSPGASGDGKDLGYLEAAAHVVGRYLHEGALVIVESIVFPGVCEHVVLPILEKESGIMRPTAERSEDGFFFAHAPATDEGSPTVIGASNIESLSRTTAFYRAIDGDIIPMRSVKEAEAVRMVEHSLHDAALALSGEFSILFDRIGIDISNVMRAVRISSIDTVSLSGIGMPRTSSAAYYLTRSGHEHQIDHQFLTSARRIIDYMPAYAVTVLSDVLREHRIALKGATIALLGLSDEGSDEQSLGSKIQSELLKKGANVQVYDPYVTGAGVDIRNALENAHAAVIAGDHAMFRNLTPRQFEEFGILAVLDTRNRLDKDAFTASPVTYRGIGRG